MALARFDVEKFTGKNDFGLWRIKMKALLTQQGIADALKDGNDFSSRHSDTQKEDILQKAHSAIILCLGDKVLREVSKEKSAPDVWKKLEQLYLKKSFANRLYMKQRVYSYKLTEERGVSEQLEEFNKSIDDVENIDVKLEDEDKAIILLNALPRSMEHLKDAMLFGREGSISLEEVQAALKAKELQKLKDEKQESSAEALNVKNFKNVAGNIKKMTQVDRNFGTSNMEEVDSKKTKRCFNCKKVGHLMKDC